MKESFSTQQRNLGNSRFKLYKPDAEKIINRTRLNEAMVFYDNAFRMGSNDEEKFKASKNIGIAYEKLIETCGKEDLTNHKAFLTYHYYLKQMCSSHSHTLTHGEKFLKPSDYSAQKERIEKTIGDNLQKLVMLNKFSCLESIAAYIKNHPQMFYYLISLIVRLYFNEGMFYMNSKLYIAAKNYFYEARQIIDIHFKAISKNAMDERTIKQFKDVNHSCNFYLKRTQVITILKEGKSYYKKAFFDEAEVDMEFCYISLTKYREALMYFYDEKENEDRRASDIELEAICIGKIAYVMYKVFKKEDKAYTMAMESITLGHSLYPKNIMSEKWYIKVREISNEIRQKRLQEEDKEAQQDYLQFAEKNPELIKEIETEAQKDYKEFVKFCLTKYPYGEIKEIDINKLDDIPKKKVLLKMSGHYHPDKQSRSNEEETKIYFIKQEISKHVNAFYNLCKQQS